MLKNLILAKNLYLQKNHKKILDNLNFELKPGENLAIIGPNGSGKSFLVSLLAADILPSFGSELWILGQKIGKTNLNLLRQKIGFVSSKQLFWLNEKNSVLEIICTGFFGSYGVNAKITLDQIESIKIILEKFEIQDLLKKCFQVLSDGEKRKVLVCRSLILSPKFLVLDEPCQGLDIISRENFLQFLDSLSKEISLIYVGHHLEELPSCITHFLFLKEGKIFKFGKKEEVLNSKNLSNLFSLSLTLIKKNSRYWLLLN